MVFLVLYMYRRQEATLSQDVESNESLDEKDEKDEKAEKDVKDAY